MWDIDIGMNNRKCGIAGMQETHNMEGSEISLGIYCAYYSKAEGKHGNNGISGVSIILKKNHK